MKRITLLIAMMAICMLSIHAKSYPFDMTHSYEVQIVRVAQQGSKFLKAWGIDRAMQDAVAACIFTGVEGNEIAGKIPALVPSKEAYEQHKQFFDTFFKKGEFLQYVKNANTGYPTGENNIKTDKGRKVGIYVVVMYDNLRKRLEDEGIVKKLNSYF